MDRDGVIIGHRADYVTSWSDVRFLPGALTAIARIGAVHPVVIVSNQSPIGRGCQDRDTIVDLHMRIVDAIAASGGTVLASYLCPHAPADRCECRKPGAGLLRQAADDLGLSLPSSWMIGDAVSDIEAGLACGARPILVSTGRGRQQTPLVRSAHPDCTVVADLSEVADLLLDAHRS